MGETRDFDDLPIKKVILFTEPLVYQRVVEE